MCCRCSTPSRRADDHATRGRGGVEPRWRGGSGDPSQIYTATLSTGQRFRLHRAPHDVEGARPLAVDHAVVVAGSRYRFRCRSSRGDRGAARPVAELQDVRVDRATSRAIRIRAAGSRARSAMRSRRSTAARRRRPGARIRTSRSARATRRPTASAATSTAAPTLTPEEILADQPHHGTTRVRNNFFTDYSWAIKGGGGEDLSSIDPGRDRLLGRQRSAAVIPVDMIEEFRGHSGGGHHSR